MTNAQHTPGPWTVEKRTDMEIAINQYEGRYQHTVCEIHHARSDDLTARAYADADLIAAAPELLEALELAYQALSEEKGFYQSTTAIKIRSAIAKAAGEGR